MRLGAEVTGMTYNCSSSSARRTCITPKNMRTSYCQDGSDLNVKRIHWIFHELPVGTHQDILMQRRKHADWVVEKVQKQMNVRWAPKKEGETSSHKNCIEHMYKRIINKKKQTIIKGGDANKHGRLPFVRHPKTYTESKKATHYKRGKRGRFVCIRSMASLYPSFPTPSISNAHACSLLRIPSSTDRKEYIDAILQQG